MRGTTALTARDGVGARTATLVRIGNDGLGRRANRDDALHLVEELERLATQQQRLAGLGPQELALPAGVPVVVALALLSR